MKPSFKAAVILYFFIVAAYVFTSVQQHGWLLIHPLIHNLPAKWSHNVHHFQNSSAVNELAPTTLTRYFRGNPQRHGIAEVKEFSVWKQKLLIPELNVGVHTAAKSSPIGDDERVYVGSDAGWFYALDRKTKNVVWKLYAPSATRGIHSNAIINGDRIWIGDYFGRLYCLEARTGKLIWVRQLGNTIGASPLFFKNHLYVNAEVVPEDGFVAKINAATGDLIWQSEPLGQQSHSSPSVSEDGVQLFLGANNSRFFSFDTETGKLIWSVPTDAPVKGSSLVWKDRVYFVDQSGAFVVLNTKTGATILKTTGRALAMSSPTLDPENNIIYYTDSVRLFRFEIEKQTTTEVDLGGKNSWASPQFIRGPRSRIITVCRDRVICEVSLDLKNVKELFDTHYRLSSTPALLGNQIWTASNLGPLQVYEGTSL